MAAERGLTFRAQSPRLEALDEVAEFLAQLTQQTLAALEQLEGQPPV